MLRFVRALEAAEVERAESRFVQRAELLRAEEALEAAGQRPPLPSRGAAAEAVELHWPFRKNQYKRIPRAGRAGISCST